MFRAFLKAHPSLRDALVWVVPAVLFGALLRGCLLYYLPYAYWGADSRSYFDFAYKLLGEHYISLIEKRRFLYPIFIAFVTLLPGPPLRWLPWLQHGFGLLTLVPLAYVMRKSFCFWKWWIVPVTVLYAGLPVVLWYEHELLGETIFFALVIWSFAGWVAWVQASPERAGRLWWAFFVPFTLMLLTKPAGRFFWPGLLVGLVAVAAWKRLRRPHWISLAALLAVTPFIGSKVHGAWLLYTATFPLTQLETPLHAEYKAQIADLVAPLRDDLDTYFERDEVPFNFLENPTRMPERKLWASLEKKPKVKARIYTDLAKEAILARPVDFLWLGLQRLGASANLSRFKQDRFEPGEFPERFEDDYETARRRVAEKSPTLVPLALGYPAKGPIPPYEEVRPRLSPAPQSWAARFVPAWVDGYLRHSEMVTLPGKRFSEARPTPLAIWVLLGAALACLVPRYRPTLGVWTLAAFGYLAGVFLVTQVNPRYFAPAWPVLVVLLAVPADAIAVLIQSWRRRSKGAK